MEEAYKIKIPVFEGPFDLLLHLIHENKLDIYDIPIALITRQYLEYIELMKELNLEVAGEFLVTAATLIQIKSRMLLPVEETAEAEEAEDPRLELVQRLIEYKAFKEAALALKEKQGEREGVFTREFEDGHGRDAGEEGGEEELPLFDLSLFDLIGAFRKIIEKAPASAVALTREVLTMKDKMSVIIGMLEGRETVRFEELFHGDVRGMEMIVTFIALLELLRLGLARAYQEGEFGAIWVMRPAS